MGCDCGMDRERAAEDDGGTGQPGPERLAHDDAEGNGSGRQSFPRSRCRAVGREESHRGSVHSQLRQAFQGCPPPLHLLALPVFCHSPSSLPPSPYPSAPRPSRRSCSKGRVPREEESVDGGAPGRGLARASVLTQQTSSPCSWLSHLRLSVLPPEVCTESSGAATATEPWRAGPSEARASLRPQRL